MKFKSNRYKILFTLMLTIIVLSVTACTIDPTLCEESKEELKVLSYRGLLSDLFYIVFGEVYNAGDKFIKNSKIEVSLLNSQGGLVAKINATSSLSVIPPKRRSPFIGYYWGENKNFIWNITINRVTYDYADERPRALAFTHIRFYNGTLQVHVLNNCTLAVGKKMATNNLKVVAALYVQDKIVGVSAGFLNLNEPGLLWDTDTSAVVPNSEPITVLFADPFNEMEVVSAEKVVASVESRDLAAQYQLIGLREDNDWNWKLLYEEEIPKDDESGYKKGAGWNLESLITLIILTILSSLIVTALYLRRRGSRRLKKRIK